MGSLKLGLVWKLEMGCVCRVSCQHSTSSWGDSTCFMFRRPQARICQNREGCLWGGESQGLRPMQIQVHPPGLETFPLSTAPALVGVVIPHLPLACPSSPEQVPKVAAQGPDVSGTLYDP